jgi:hypothetical protein
MKAPATRFSVVGLEVGMNLSSIDATGGVKTQNWE